MRSSEWNTIAGGGRPEGAAVAYLQSVSSLDGVAETPYLFVFTHFPTENRFALFLEML
ncbi:hypothetical protein [Ensifer adhaerens]|uniref:hypothetical protein n=1 Tax=Ensifer adhaerens TaxID=106592 RepID=UPI000B277C8C|nr:hypothetical protein [Ensifer adhaerens]